MNNRQRMRASNKRVTDYLLEKGYDDIWLKIHSARNDLVRTQRGNYLATDLWNLFDGICFGGNIPFFIQIKTNSWAAAKPIKSFLINHNISVIVFNVTNKPKKCKGKYKVFSREYS